MIDDSSQERIDLIKKDLACVEIQINDINSTISKYDGRIAYLQDVIVRYEKERNIYEELIEQFQQIIEFSTEKMKQVVTSCHYESDDETGFFFKQLKDLQLLLDDVFETTNTEEHIDAKKEKG